MPGFVGIPELLLLGFVVLLIFGPKRLPEMGRSMGRGLREFKNSVGGDKHAAEELDLSALAGRPNGTDPAPETVPVAEPVPASPNAAVR